jgi:hypothetical protein
MSLTYYGETGNKFGVNSAGGSLLGYVHKALDLPISRTDRPNASEASRKLVAEWEIEFPRAPYDATETEAKEMGIKIRNISDEEILKLCQGGLKGWWGGTEPEFVEWVREWGTFLEACGGYEAE